MERRGGFNGKRPFGNGVWQYPVYIGMIKEGIIEGKIDEDGCLEETDLEVADQLIGDYIEYIFSSR